ncbi:hypothetical protein [Planctomicrobium piriforme]|uniref:Uncharacterized protein n=1 Tax=Planctomicrobium piriforme TaxID=1576369 RepID=A0A1I3EFR6_9PLAN|nr:hypothetical protein [Planctomicrobium piriforme]SFH97551.1 hypothetical protein SAMN05421753_104195 [Planctomicrobium piriforme]
MDPNATWSLLSHLLDREMSGDEAVDAIGLCEGLIGWLEMDGFMPAEISLVMGRRAFLRMLRATLEWLHCTADVLGV